MITISGLGPNLRDNTPIMENQMEKKMENEMHTGIIMGYVGDTEIFMGDIGDTGMIMGYIGVILSVTHAGAWTASRQESVEEIMH